MSNSTSGRDTIEALADSFVARLRAGERPSVEEYARRYPELSEELRELLPALVLLEQNAAPDDVATTTVAPPREIGDFTIVREIARGGMGVVYEAVQESLGRHVALKVLSTPALLNPVHLERFHLEARAAARLHHTNIVPVYGVGEHDGLHYYAMQFIQGQSLDLVIDALRQLRRPPDDDQAMPPGNDRSRAAADLLLSGQFCARGESAADAASKREPESIGSEPPDVLAATDSVRDAPSDSTSFADGTNGISASELASSHSGREFYRSVARVGLRVAEALAYAHSEGILHRDIKPSNILLDAGGNVWITDFGLARDESNDGLTKTGDFVGTLRYMAPERLEGWSDRRSDVYSLGATLYELLALKPFFDSLNRGQLVDRILHETPPPPSASDRLIPRDLETIISMAIAKEPLSRYHSADAMAEDLQRFLADRPILARRSTPTERFVRWCRRNPPLAAACGLAVAALVATIAVLAVSNIRIKRETAAKTHAVEQLDKSLGQKTKLLNEKETLLTELHAAVEKANANAAKATAISDLLKDALQSASTGNARGSDFTVRELLDEVSDNLENELVDQPEAKAALHAVIGNAYRSLEVEDKAGEHLKIALEMRRQLFGNKHPDVVESIIAQSLYINHYTKDLDASERLAREAIVINRELALNKEQLVRALYALGDSLWRRPGNYEELEEIAAEVRAIGREQNVEYPQLASIMHWMATRLRLDGEFEQAEPIAREAVELHRRLDGPQHPETAWALCERGILLYQQQKFNEAAKCFEEALAIFRHLFDDTRFPVLRQFYWLAACARSTGDTRTLDELRLQVEPLLEVERSDADSWLHQALVHVQLEQIDHSATCFAAVVRLGNLSEPLSPFDRYLASLTFIATGDVANYRKTCNEAVRSMNAHADWRTVCLTAWTCALSPESVNDDLATALEGMNRVVPSHPNNPDGDLMIGALHYRLGEYEQAAVHLRSAIDAYNAGERGAFCALHPKLFLVMTEFKLHQIPGARRLADEADAELPQALLSRPVQDGVELELLRKEIEDVLATVTKGETDEHAIFDEKSPVPTLDVSVSSRGA